MTEEDRLQLAAQAMCLEEMFSAQILEGAIFYGETRRREPVAISEDLRQEVRNCFQEMHGYYERKYTPRVKYSKSCSACSLKEICLPRLGKAVSVKTYISQMIKEEENEKLLNTLYVTSENSYLALDGENVVLFENKDELGRIPLHNLEGIVSFGYRGTSPALMGACAERNISLCYLTPQGKFLARGFRKN